jgi:hypothetical protein
MGAGISPAKAGTSLPPLALTHRGAAHQATTMRFAWIGGSGTLLSASDMNLW